MNAGHKKAPGHEPLSCRGTISHFLLFSVVIDQAAFEDDLALVIGELVHFQGDLFQAVACNVAGELAGFVLDGFADARKEEVIAVQKWRIDA